MEWIESWSQPTAKHFNCCINLQADDPSPGSNCHNQGPARLLFNVINCYPAQLLPEMSKCKVRTAALHTAAMIARWACWSSSPSRCCHRSLVPLLTLPLVTALSRTAASAPAAQSWLSPLVRPHTTAAGAVPGPGQSEAALHRARLIEWHSVFVMPLLIGHSRTWRRKLKYVSNSNVFSLWNMRIRMSNNDTKSYQKSNYILLSILYLQMVDICCTQQIYCDQSWTQNLIITNPHVSIIYHITIMGQMFLWFISLCLSFQAILLQIHRKYWSEWHRG